MNLETVGSVALAALKRVGINATVDISGTPSNGADVVVNIADDSITIKLFPAILKLNSTQAVKSVVVAVGQAIYDRLTDADKLAWTKKLVFATDEDISAFQTKLQSQSYPTFKDLVDSLPQAVSRLVAIHLSNGILSSGQSITSASNLKVIHWGPTAELATQKKPYSLVPLISSYAPSDIFHDFAAAFSALALNSLDRVTESSCKKAFTGLIMFLVQQGRPKSSAV